MAKEKVPVTSTELLRGMADSQHASWGVFYDRYKPMMQAFMRERFPSLEADDIIQETLVALAKVLVRYVHNPEVDGYFHNYLTGILRNKALDQLNREKRRSSLKDRYSAELQTVSDARTAPDDSWRNSVFNIALQQFFADDTVQERTKQIFRRVAIDGEKPESVAEAYGITRNAVDQIKARSLAKLKETVNALEKMGDGPIGHE